MIIINVAFFFSLFRCNLIISSLSIHQARINRQALESNNNNKKFEKQWLISTQSMLHLFNYHYFVIRDFFLLFINSIAFFFVFGGCFKSKNEKSKVNTINIIKKEREMRINANYNGFLKFIFFFSLFISIKSRLLKHRFIGFIVIIVIIFKPLLQSFI